MAATPTPTPIAFDLIEPHKENIQALPSGRSATALAALYSPTPQQATTTTDTTTDPHALTRTAYEAELLNADDPLDVYTRYINWTLTTYPSASASAESQLRPLLTRATRALLTDDSNSSCKTDARYLKLWLLYIHLFCQGSDIATTGPTSSSTSSRPGVSDGEAARDAYVFLSRNGVGQGLALFYESYAEWLELQGRWCQAAEIWELGIERQARPVERLLRRFADFEKRRDARAGGEEGGLQGPSSPALPVLRQPLGVRRDVLSSASTAEVVDPQAADRERDRVARAAGAARAGRRPKIEVFADGDENGEPKLAAGAGSGVWESIGDLVQRKKENTAEAQSWAGQKLDGGKKHGGPKMAVFRDASESTLSPFHESQTTVNPRTGKPECVYVNLEAVYPNLGEPAAAEFCFEELRARHRGWMDRDWSKAAKLEKPKKTKQEKQKAQDKKGAKGLAIFIDEDTMSARSLLKARKQKNDADRLVRELQQSPTKIDGNETAGDKENVGPLPSELDAKAAKKAARREERANRTRKIRVAEVRAEPQTVPANLSSPTGPKMKRKKSSEQTMTICTKEAMDEIYDIFNQPAKVITGPNAEDAESESSDDEYGYTSGCESTGTGRISGATSEFGDETGPGIEFTETCAIEARSTADEDGTMTNDTAWSSFTQVKDALDGIDTEEVETEAVTVTGASFSDPMANGVLVLEDVVTPISPSVTYTIASHPPMFVPIPPEDYDIPTHPFRNQYQAANNRLPFMTPIVEKTEESSIGAATALATAAMEKDYFSSKTPCRPISKRPRATSPGNDDGLWSSPFEEDVKEKESLLDVKVPQPALPKPQKPSKPSLGVSKANIERLPLVTKPVSSVKDGVPKGPLIQDTQCNPVDESIRNQILDNVQPPLSTYDGYHDRRMETCGKDSEIKKFTRAVAKAGKNTNDKTATNLSMPPQLRFEGSDRVYAVKRELGKGAYAPVYLVESRSRSRPRSDEDEEEAPAQMGKGAFGLVRGELEAVKMEDPPTAWEFYIMRQAKRRLGVSRAADSVVHAYEMHLFRDECYLVEEYRDQGTLLNLINISRADATSGAVMDEIMAMFFSVELLRTVEGLHAKGLIHGDLKADNILLRLPAGPTNLGSSFSDRWSSQYQRDGTQGWSERGIALIDFGRGIDMKVFRPDVQFIADWKTTEADCAEMREMRPWTYQVDYHGLAGVVHSLLFGKYIETTAERGAALGAGATKTYKVREGLKRYWQTEIWRECFDVLLNPLSKLSGEEGGKMPLVKGMRRVREKMESHLESSSEKGTGLKALLRRMEGSVRDKRR